MPPQPFPADAWPVRGAEELGARLADAGWSLVEFWSPDNLFCRLMAPIRIGLRDSHGDRLTLLCCVIDARGDEGLAYGAIAVPALILYHRGSLVRRWLGARDLSLLRSSIDKALAGGAVTAAASLFEATSHALPEVTAPSPEGAAAHASGRVT